MVLNVNVPVGREGNELYSYRISLFLCLGEDKIPLVGDNVCLVMKVF